ncbi:WD40 repeat-like protein [Rhodotorula sp. JG-1b]|nr:WD40 repeat-like protein [Rhodotorula sp. JG-1b]
MSTAGLEVGVESAASTGGAGRETAEELRARIVAELEAERQRLDAEIALEKRLAEEQLEAERARGLSGEQLSSVLASPGFVEFLEQSTKVVQRALSDPYDYLRDYSINADEDAAAAEGKKARVRLLGAWQDQQWGRGRSVTSVDWSPKASFLLFVAAYNKKPFSINEPDGIAAVWNLHLQDRPEYVFHAQSGILSIAFSPFNSNLVVGGTYSGQILLWDTRSRHSNAVLKTPLSTSGHTHPVYSLALLGTQNANSLVSASTDGVVCAWSLDMLARPQETLELVHPAHNKTDEVSITSLGFPLGETATFWCGTEEGNVYAAHRYDRAGAKAGLIHNEVYRGHSGPVTGLDFHPAEGSVDLSDLFLTSGVDWTVKLWRAGGANPARTAAGGRSSLSSSRLGSSNSGPPPPGTVSPLFTFEEAGDYVYDVRWHPLHPAVFGTVDAAGKFNLWNLNVDAEVRVATLESQDARPRGLNKLAWERTEGRRAAVGSSDGKVYVYEISPDLVRPREGDWDQMRRTCNAALAEQLSPDGYR